MKKKLQAIKFCSDITKDIKNIMESFRNRSEIITQSNIRELAELFSLSDFKSILFELSKDESFTLIDIVMPDEYHYRTTEIDASKIITLCPNSSFFWVDEFLIAGKEIKISLSNNHKTLMVVASCN